MICVLKYQISVDISPPEVGIVKDGMPGMPEIDYQSTMDLNAHWDGFFDKESGIKFYLYIFDTQCRNQNDWKTTIKDSVRHYFRQIYSRLVMMDVRNC